MKTIQSGRTYKWIALGLIEPGGIPDTPRNVADQALARIAAAREAADGGQFILRKENPTDLALHATWRGLLGSSESAERIYQSPEFLQFLSLCSDDEQFSLFSITRRHDAQILGLVPVRLGNETLDFGVGKFKVVRILGSVALVPQAGVLAQQVITELMMRFPQADAVSMQAVPAESQWWQAMAAGSPAKPGCRPYLLNDWRDCHTVPLPDSFDAYLKQFSSKKRYNLSRQVKQLEAEAGEIAVQRIVDAAGVPAMFAVASGLASPAERHGFLSEREYAALAECGLLLSYVISCGGKPVGAVIGSLSCGVWHVYKILWQVEYAGLSIGTSVLHLCIKDAMANYRLTSIDFGYGSPNREFKSSHVLRKRAHVLMYRATVRNRIVIGIHAGLSSLSTPLSRFLKAIPKWVARVGLSKRCSAGT